MTLEGRRCDRCDPSFGCFNSPASCREVPLAGAETHSKMTLTELCQWARRQVAISRVTYGGVDAATLEIAESIVRLMDGPNECERCGR